MTTELGIEQQNRSALLGSLAVVLAAAAWGTSGIFVKFIVAETGVSALALAQARERVVTLGAEVLRLQAQWTVMQERLIVLLKLSGIPLVAHPRLGHSPAGTAGCDA